MFRLSLLVCTSLLLCGITAKPFKPSGKVADAAFQKTLMDLTEGKMPLGLREVEPPEDMDVTDYDINPNMAIWKNMRGNGQEEKYLKAEKDSDDLYHPSMEQSQMADVLRAWPQPEDTFSWVDVQAEPLEEGDNLEYYQEAEVDQDAMSHTFSEQMEPEVDWDEVYHPGTKEGGDGTYQVVVPLQEELIPQGDFHRVHTVPEEDVDDIYHGDRSAHTQVDPLPQEAEVRDQSKVIKNKQPEEDRDDVYHADPPASVPYHKVADTPVAALLPYDQAVQRMHTQPEEDLDHLYHH
ncbi:uncharacterized protein si:ch211-217g15.3 isoform X1 [Hypomesus transpacificus]|uniref:uncharacterized protein si:ch211-217g15.3 isoform X1 n=1 Tax=Hypomesus transpacificus TaxID=137520 RepID=UPI001F077EBA|nr:uncharacterized protein si:ch211-217g15.3 isoform X1 [Hypomesus transpacificus]XP_046886136.1 uncharacterized protein si:ch211-217g15.3 isoform X1 [Hypomesus transpacificus]